MNGSLSPTSSLYSRVSPFTLVNLSYHSSFQVIGYHLTYYCQIPVICTFPLIHWWFYFFTWGLYSLAIDPWFKLSIALVLMSSLGIEDRTLHPLLNYREFRISCSLVLGYLFATPCFWSFHPSVSYVHLESFDHTQIS